MRMRFAIPLLLAGVLCAQDTRNTNTPNTDTHFVPKVYKTLAEWESQKAHLRKQILSATGLMPTFAKTDLHPQIFGRIENRDYSIEKVLIETLPGFYLGGNLYRPLKAAPPEGFPAIISPHGHWTYGRLEHTNIVSIPARCINLARQGYVVFAYDMLGYNDTVQTPHDFGDKPEEQLWAFGPLGLQLWNCIRAIDFLESLPGVNRNRIGATGASGGATQTMLTAAVDDRIQYDAPANMVSLMMQGGGLCENAPNLRLGTNNVEIAAMMAPRPMLMTAATEDWTRHMMEEEYPAVRAIYDLYGKRDNVEALLLQAPHNYNQPNREAMYAFFGKHVLGITDATKLKERNIRVEKLQDMLALHGRKLPDNALNFQQIFDEWKRLSRAQTGDEKERLSLALAAEWAPSATATTMTITGDPESGSATNLYRPGKGDRVPAIWKAGSGPPTVLVHPEGIEAARRSPEFAELLREKRSFLLIDAFQTGKAVAPRDRSVKMFLTFNKSDDANRVQDILTALAFLKTPHTRLIGIGKAATWCAFAAAVAPEPVDLVSKIPTELGDFFVPGIERAGGLAALHKVLR